MSWTRLGLLALFLLAFALRVYRLDFQSIWTDEGFAVGLASRSLPELVAVWNISPQDQSYTVFAHLLDRQNRIWAQHDGIPAGDSPTSGWLEGEVVVDRHILPIRGDAPPGEYVLEAGMYEARSGRRLAVSAAQAQVVGQALWLERVRVR